MQTVAFAVRAATRPDPVHPYLQSDQLKHAKTERDPDPEVDQLAASRYLRQLLLDEVEVIGDAICILGDPRLGAAWPGGGIVSSILGMAEDG